MLYVIIAILIFSVLIAVHEFGHFITAKFFGIRVNEFAIGMGPALFQRQKGETLYSLRVLPIGGYCAMEGEDDDSDDPRAFGQVASWKQIIVLAAGAFMNFVTGLILIFVIFAQAQSFVLPAISGFLDGYGAETSGFQAGDVVTSIDGHRIYNYNNLFTYLGRAGDTLDVVVKRGGEKVEIDDMHLPMQERTGEDGAITNYRGISVGMELLPPTIGNKLLYSWYGAVDFVRLVWMSLGDLISGAVGVKDLSGPVGIVDTMTQVGSQSASALDAANNLIYFAALIAVNLAVMNLLPLPALDGGRIFFLLLNNIVFLIFRKKIDPKYEGYVHFAGLAALMCLMLFVTFGDIGRIFTR